eukprot:g3555.t1
MGTSLLCDEESNRLWCVAFCFTWKYRGGAAFKAYYKVRAFMTFHGIFMASGYDGYDMGKGSVWNRNESTSTDENKAENERNGEDLLGKSLKNKRTTSLDESPKEKSEEPKETKTKHSEKKSENKTFLDNFFGDNSFWQEDEDDEPYDPSKEYEEEEEEEEEEEFTTPSTPSSSTSTSESDDDNDSTLDLRTSTPKRRKRKRTSLIATRTRAKLDMKGKDFDWDKFDKDLEAHDTDAWLPTLDMFTEEEKDYRRFLMNDDLDESKEDEDDFVPPGTPMDDQGYQSGGELAVTEQEIMDLLAEPEDEMTKMIMNARSAKRDQPVTSQHISRMKTQLNALCQILIQLTSTVADRVDRRLVKSKIPQNTNLMDVVEIMKRVVENRDTERNIRTQLKELPITIWTRKQRELAHKRVMSGVAEKLHGFHVRPRGVNVQSLFECKAVDDVRVVMEDINSSLRSHSSLSEIDWIANAIHQGKTTHKPWFDATLCIAPKRKRKPKKVRRWNEEEDTLLIQAVKRYGTGRRAYDQMVENLIPCRKRTTVRDRIRALKSKSSSTGRRLRSALVGMPWTAEDDEVLLNGHKKYKYDWEKIHKFKLPYRGPVRLRNRFMELKRLNTTQLQRRESKWRRDSRIITYSKEVVPDSDDEIVTQDGTKFVREELPSDSEDEDDERKKSERTFAREELPSDSDSDDDDDDDDDEGKKSKFER